LKVFLALFGLPLLSMAASSLLHLYNAKYVYPTLTLYSGDSKLTKAACDNYISTSISLLISFQLSVSILRNMLMVWK